VDCYFDVAEVATLATTPEPTIAPRTESKYRTSTNYIIYVDLRKKVSTAAVRRIVSRTLINWRHFISERELTFTFAICYRPSVCSICILGMSAHL